MRNIPEKLQNKEILEEYLHTLSRYNSYFTYLDKENKKKFVVRLNHFLNSTYFITRKDLKVNNSMQIIIASAFVQITFGLKEYTLKEYNRIYIAPRPYTYKGMEKYLLDGDVNRMTKIVSLAWPSVIKGFQIEDDAINVAIHEFGHCLAIENFSRMYFTQFFSEDEWKNWLKLAQEKIKVIRARKNKVIRNYGGTNLMELFAVSLENFFEQSEYFKKHLPILYNSLSKMLNQDPINRFNPVLG